MATLLTIDELYKRTAGSGTVADTDFAILKIEDLFNSQAESAQKKSYRKRSYFKIALVKGKSRIYYADQVIDVRRCALVFTNPFIPYQWERENNEQSGLICIFHEHFLSQFGNIGNYPAFSCPSNAVIELDQEQETAFGQLFEKIGNELSGQYRYKNELLGNLIMEILHEAQKMQPVLGEPLTGVGASERITLLFRSLLEEQFPIGDGERLLLHSPGIFAERLNIHVNHLNKVLRETTGTSTFRLINDRIAREAMHLLKHTDRTISDISWSLAFNEPHRFSKAFKQLVGLSPSHYRNSPQA